MRCSLCGGSKASSLLRHTGNDIGFVCKDCGHLNFFAKAPQMFNYDDGALIEENIDKRPSKDEYYLGIADAVSRRSTCLRRQYGAVIVKNDKIISTGYNGAAKGMPNCNVVGSCWREDNNIPHGQQYEACVAVHAEQNALLSPAMSDMEGATLYLFGNEHGEAIKDPIPCKICARMILNSGIKRVVSRAATYNTNKLMEVVK